MFILLCSIFIFRLDAYKLNNIKNFKLNVSNLLYLKNENYLENEYKEFVNYYKNLTQNDKCIQSIYDDVSLPYLLKKPTCTKFYITAHIINNWSDKLFLKEFQKSKPTYILYDGPYKFLTDRKNLIEVDNYIKDNYKFFNDFKGWIIYKKINKYE